MAKAKILCVFKHKEDILFRVYDYGGYFFCEWDWNSMKWSEYDTLQRMAITEAFKLTKQFKTIEELRQGTKYYTSDYRFVWEGYLYG